VADLEQRLLEHFGASHSIQFELRGGGMSRVFVAEDVALKRKVVIKVLNPALAATVSVQRFQREISVVAKLNHPNIVPVLTAGEVDSLPYFIMPYIEGESLRGRIGRGPLSLRETVAILKDVMRALAYAHSAGIVHRDIKPDNILLAGNAALVTDFGVAKAVSAARERGQVQAGQTITGVGISLGTPQYMAPEQAAADPNADARVDFYALGIVAYEMLVGSPPFHGRTPQALLAAQLTELPPPLASRRYDVPVALSNLLMKCLEKDPADRPRTASELIHVLESPEALSGPVAATPEAVAKKRWRVLSTAFSALLVTSLLGALVVWSLWPTAQAPAATTAVTPAVGVTIRVNPVMPIGPESAAPASALSAAIESSLLRAGLRLASGTGRATAADSNTIVVETTLQRAGDRARALVRVLTADPSVPVWADQLDFRVAESFAAQDTLAARVVRAVIDARARLQ
jgi:tRNA A-37 threonylcarbamoyl transferase component Bud32